MSVYRFNQKEYDFNGKVGEYIHSEPFLNRTIQEVEYDLITLPVIVDVVLDYLLFDYNSMGEQEREIARNAIVALAKLDETFIDKLLENQELVEMVLESEKEDY